MIRFSRRSRVGLTAACLALSGCGSSEHLTAATFQLDALPSALTNSARLATIDFDDDGDQVIDATLKLAYDADNQLTGGVIVFVGAGRPDIPFLAQSGLSERPKPLGTDPDREDDGNVDAYRASTTRPGTYELDQNQDGRAEESYASEHDARGRLVRRTYDHDADGDADAELRFGYDLCEGLCGSHHAHTRTQNRQVDAPSTPLRVNTRAIGSGIAVITISGDLVTGREAFLQSEVRTQMLYGQTKFVVNLQSVGRLDSDGLGQLVRAYTLTQSQGGQLVLAATPLPLLDYLLLTKLLTVFAPYDSEEQAVAALRG